MAKKILIVDDDTLFREMLDEVLRAAGYETTQAEDGREGFAVFKTYTPDLVVTDIRMPKRNGVQMAQDILEISPQTPIIFISGWYDPRRLFSEKGLDATFLKNDAFCIHFLRKPFRLPQLLTLIEKVAAPCTKHRAA